MPYTRPGDARLNKRGTFGRVVYAIRSERRGVDGHAKPSRQRTEPRQPAQGILMREQRQPERAGTLVAPCLAGYQARPSLTPGGVRCNAVGPSSAETGDRVWNPATSSGSSRGPLLRREAAGTGGAPSRSRTPARSASPVAGTCRRGLCLSAGRRSRSEDLKEGRG
jgi:hypothetical protein